MRCWAVVIGAGASAGVGRSSDVRPDELGVSEGDCVTLGDCMRVALEGEWGRGEDIVAMASCLCAVLLAEDFVVTFLTFGGSLGKQAIVHFLEALI